jgi:hypothetical protein
MLAIDNDSPYRVGLLPTLDGHGRDGFTVVVKGTYRLLEGRSCALAPAQAEILLADVYRGPAGTSSVLYGGDGAWTKRAADVVLVGHAHAREPVRQLDVSLSVGPLRKVVRVLGDRRWLRARGGWVASEPAPFTRLPLCYEQAFGGEGEPANPVGVGAWSLPHHRESAREGAALPNLEAPDALMTAPDDRPAPAGLGFVAPHWSPRRAFAGTYDAAWREEQRPLLPLDFDERFWSAAPHDQQGVLHGGERVRVENAWVGGALDFALPTAAIVVEALIDGACVASAAPLDTVVIEPDRERVMLTWRAALACARRTLRLERVRVAEAA